MDVLAENAVGPASRGRLARARAAVKKHTDYSEHGYFLAVEMAFKHWKPCKTSVRHKRPPTARKMVLSSLHRFLFPDRA
jgi:hypothetical protein